MMLYLLFLAVPAAAQILGLKEGEVCLNGGTCQRVKNCNPRIDLTKTRPRVCSFDSNDPIVCCPSESISIKKCREYSETHCSRGGLIRFKRQLTIATGIIPDEFWENRPSVMGGIEANPRELTYMALVGYGNPPSINWACGGSVISEKFVLTAAHCVSSGFQDPAKWVRVGELNLANNNEDANPLDFAIERSYVHPQYKAPDSYNDIALLLVDRTIQFSEWVKPICLHTKKDITESVATAAGWGRVEFAGPTSDSLLKVNVTIYEGNECKRLLGNTGRFRVKGIDTNTMVCAGEREGGKDTCSGDSGGPLLVKSEHGCMSQQIGIVSFGRYCGLANTPAVYTRVSYFVPWIEGIVWPQNVTA